MSSHPLPASVPPIRLRSVPIEQVPLDIVELGIPKGLPRPLTSLIGREVEVATVRGLLLDEGVRLLTLTGPGGVGKTRLALRIADEVAAAFPDGVVFVPLAPIRDPDLVLPAIARELELRDTYTMGPHDLLIDFLRYRRLLLVLDNVEQVRRAAPELTALLAACPDLVILATSRARLHVSGEHRFPVAPLAVTSDLRRSPAVELFVTRAQASDPRFALDKDNADAIAAICRRLDGLPLAIELAAARIPFLAPGELRARFDRALPYLSDGPVDAPDRQRTMRQAIAWSYDLLSPAEQALFRRLAVFVGGFSLEAAERVGGDGFAGGGDGLTASGGAEEEATAFSNLSPLSAASPSKAAAPPPSPERPSVFELLSALLDHSLLFRGPQPNGESRFALLETVREFGLEELARCGEEGQARDAHAGYVLDLAERAEPELQGAAWEAWVDRLVSELPNVRAALGYFRERSDGERAVRLAGAIGLFWTLPSAIREGRGWLEMAVALPGAERTPAALATALNAIAVVAQWQYDFPCIEAALERALAIRQDLGDELGVAEVLGNLGNAALDAGDLARAEALLAESLPIYERHGHTFWAGETLTLLGHAVRARGDGDRSVAHHEAAVATLRQLPGQNKLSDALISLGWAEAVRGEPSRSRAAYREGLALAETSDDRMRMGRTVSGAAALAAAGGAPALAARLLAAAAAQRDEEQIQLKPTIQAELDRVTARVRDALSEAAFAAAWAAGRSLRLEEAVVEAKAVLAESWIPKRSTGAATAGPRLTPREWEVLRLLATGRSDKEIAGELFISARTASTHVAAIIAKLGVPSRTAAAAIAARDLLT